jgi:hypothetical protein
MHDRNVSALGEAGGSDAFSGGARSLYASSQASFSNSLLQFTSAIHFCNSLLIRSLRFLPPRAVHQVFQHAPTLPAECHRWPSPALDPSFRVSRKLLQTSLSSTELGTVTLCVDRRFSDRVLIFTGQTMDVQMSEEQIRTLAFYLWEQDGSPDGRADEYWEKARQQLGLEGATRDGKAVDESETETAGFGEEPEAKSGRPLAE